jgi:hypothetical protein
MTAAIQVLQAMAVFDGPRIAVYPRIGGFEGRIYVDLGTPDWRAVEIDSDGWRIVERAPIRFIRSAGAEGLPEPVPGGSITKFRELFSSLATDDDFVMLVGWILASFKLEEALPVLGVFGPHGSAKTTLLRGARRLIDPNVLDTRTLPRDERDLMIISQTSWVQSFDNVSNLSPDLSDAFCRLSTGNAFGTRKLFTDTGEIILVARRPSAFTGIVECIERPDLIDRAFFVHTTEIPEGKRLAEKTFWRQFNAAWPGMLGVILDAVSMALRRQDEEPANLPRMASACAWIIAGEEALGWKPGTFLSAYRRNIQQGAQAAVDADPVGSAVVAFMSDPVPAQRGLPVAPRRELWEGTTTELLGLLRIKTGEDAARSRGWPKTPARLGLALRALVPSLSRIGIVLKFFTTHDARLLELRWKSAGGADQPESDDTAQEEAPASDPPEGDASATTGSKGSRRTKL